MSEFKHYVISLYARHIKNIYLPLRFIAAKIRAAIKNGRPTAKIVPSTLPPVCSPNCFFLGEDERKEGLGEGLGEGPGPGEGLGEG